MCAESHKINSGFGLYTREVLSRLQATGKYELAEFSCYNKSSNNNTVPWKVYANAVDNNSPQYSQYSSNPTNAFGQWRFDKVVLDFRPDIVFDIRDFWMFAYQELSPLRKYFHWVLAPTIDSLPQKNSWLKLFENADIVLAHTDWAIDYLKSSTRQIITGPSVSDSVDSNVYKPISYKKSFHKAKHLLPTNSFVVGSVMRNQKRKLIPNLFNSIKKLIQFSRNSDIYLYLHTSYPESAGWDIPDLLQEYDMHNNVLFTYLCKGCRKSFGSKFHGAKRLCPFCDTGVCAMPNVIDGLTDNQMSDIYNLFDIYVQYAICEGLGIPQLEAASCGVPICSVDYSAMSEVSSKLEGYKVSYALFKELETNAYRAVPNDSHLVQILYEFMRLDPASKSDMSANIRNKILENYSWDKTAKVFEEIFDSIEPKNNWDDPMETDHTRKVPNDIVSNKEFIKFLVLEVLKEPELWKTNTIQEIIKNLDAGYHNNNGTIALFTRADAVKILEAFLTNKVYFEEIRSGKKPLDDEFIVQSKK